MNNEKETPLGAFDVVLNQALERAGRATFAGGLGALGGSAGLVLAYAVTLGVIGSSAAMTFFPLVAFGWTLLAAGGFLVGARCGQLIDRAVDLE